VAEEWSDNDKGECRKRFPMAKSTRPASGSLQP